jgi:hypothetical protein
VFRPRTRGVKCIVECDGKWLMIRNTPFEHEIDHKEILEAAWIAPADLPDVRSGTVDLALRLLQ